MKKILLFSDYPSREKPTYYSFIKNYVKAIKDIYNVIVVKVNVSSTIETGVIYERDEDCELITLNIKGIQVPKAKLFYNSIVISSFLKKIIKEVSPDIVHVHFSSYYSWVVNKICKKFNIPYVVTEHATFFETMINKFYYGSKIKKALQEATVVTAVSNPLKRTMEKYIDRKDIIVIPNVIDTSLFCYKNKYHDNKEKFCFITVGSLDLNDKKGYEILLEALYKLKKRYSDAFLLL